MSQDNENDDKSPPQGQGLSVMDEAARRKWEEILLSIHEAMHFSHFEDPLLQARVLEAKNLVLSEKNKQLVDEMALKDEQISTQESTIKDLQVSLAQKNRNLEKYRKRLVRAKSNNGSGDIRGNTIHLNS